MNPRAEAFVKAMRVGMGHLMASGEAKERFQEWTLKPELLDAYMKTLAEDDPDRKFVQYNLDFQAAKEKGREALGEFIFRWRMQLIQEMGVNDPGLGSSRVTEESLREHVEEALDRYFPSEKSDTEIICLDEVGKIPPALLDELLRR